MVCAPVNVATAGAKTMARLPAISVLPLTGMDAGQTASERRGVYRAQMSPGCFTPTT